MPNALSSVVGVVSCTDIDAIIGYFIVTLGVNFNNAMHALKHTTISVDFSGNMWECSKLSKIKIHQVLS